MQIPLVLGPSGGIIDISPPDASSFVQMEDRKFHGHHRSHLGTLRGGLSARGICRPSDQEREKGMGLNIFSSSFRSERHFWMGQGGDYGTLTSNLDYSMDLYAKVNAWLSNTLNPRDALGSDADQFQAVNTDIRSLFDNAVGIAEKLRAGMAPTDDEVSTVRRFNDDAGVLYGIIQQHPATTTTSRGPAGAALTVPSTPGPGQTSAGGANQITQAITQAAKDIVAAQKGGTPAKPGVVPAAPASSNLTTPLLVGGGIAALIVIALVATAK